MSGAGFSHRAKLGVSLLVGTGCLQVLSIYLSAQKTEPELRFYVDYSAKPDADALLSHNLCILDPASVVDLQRGQQNGNVYLAYVSAVEVLPGTPNAAKAGARGISTLAHNAEWGADVLDVTDGAWLDFVVEDLAAAALAKGYDGLFLDTLESTARIVAAKPRKAAACHAALITLIKKLHARFPQTRIVLNRGFDLIDEIASNINGVVVEGLYQTGDATGKKYQALSTSDTRWLLDRIHRVQARRLPVFVIDYVAPDELDLARRTAKQIAAQGCVPFVTTPELRGKILAPLFSHGIGNDR
jgi:hypothetical protein